MRAGNATAVLLWGAAVCFGVATAGAGTGVSSDHLLFVDGADLRCGLDTRNGAATCLRSRVAGKSQQWTVEPIRVEVRNEVTGIAAKPSTISVESTPAGLIVRRRYAALSLSATESWQQTATGLVWDLVFEGNQEPVGYEVVIDLPVLSRRRRVFTPSELGVTSVGAQPTFRPAAVWHHQTPYRALLNPIERVHLDVHAEVTRNHRCQAIDELVGKVEYYLKDRSRETWRAEQRVVT